MNTITIIAAVIKNKPVGDIIKSFNRFIFLQNLISFANDKYYAAFFFW